MKSSGKVLLYLLVIILAAFLISIIFMYTRENPEEIRKKNSSLRVEVLNGCGENRLAIKVANVLRRRGFNVVTIGNATQSNFEKTVVIERSRDDYSNAKYFARRIKCKYIGKDIDPALHLEVSLILGLDYSRYFTDLSEEF